MFFAMNSGYTNLCSNR